MRVTTNIKDLSAAIRTIKPALARGGYAPVLTYARLEAEGDTLTLTASDLDLSTRVSIPATVIEPGVALARGVELGKASKGKGRIELVGDGETFRTVNGITTTIPTMADDEWPKLQMATEDAAVTLQVDVELIRSVVVAASGDGARPILTGVLFGHDGTNGYMVGTDSYRLHLVTLPVRASGWDALVGEPVNIPARALAAAASHCKTGTVSITIGPDQHQARTNKMAVITAPGGATWAVRTIDGEYPNIWSLLDSCTDQGSMVFPRPALEEVLAHVASVDKDAVARFASDPAGMRVTSSPYRSSDILTEAVIPGYTEGQWAANPRYLGDAIHGLTTCTLTLGMPLKPMSISEVDDAGNLHRRVVMPINVG